MSDDPLVLRLLDHVVRLAGDVGAARAGGEAAKERVDRLALDHKETEARVSVLKEQSQPPEIIRLHGEAITRLETREQTRAAYTKGVWSWPFALGNLSGLAGGLIGAALLLGVLKTWGWVQ